MIYFNLDLGALGELAKEFRPTVQRAMAEAARDLAAQTHAHILEEVQEKLQATLRSVRDLEQGIKARLGNLDQEVAASVLAPLSAGRDDSEEGGDATRRRIRCAE